MIQLNTNDSPGWGLEQKKNNKCYKKHYWDKLTEDRLQGLPQKSSDLRLHLAMQGTQVPSLVRELRSHMCHGVVKRFFFLKKKKKTTEYATWCINF